MKNISQSLSRGFGFTAAVMFLGGVLLFAGCEIKPNPDKVEACLVQNRACVAQCDADQADCNDGLATGMAECANLVADPAAYAQCVGAVIAQWSACSAEVETCRQNCFDEAIRCYSDSFE